MNTAKLRSKRIIIPTVAAIAVLGIGGTVWAANGGTDSTDELQGSERDRVAAAALEATGGGEVTDVETSDDPGEAYEVEVQMEDGTEVHVDLDDDLNVVGQHVEHDDDFDGPETDGRHHDHDHDDDFDDDSEMEGHHGERPDADGSHQDERPEMPAPGQGGPEQGGPDMMAPGDDGRGPQGDRDDRDDRDDRALSKSEQQSAREAALKAVGGGRVTDIDAGHGGLVAYDVEVDKSGTEWDVHLDKSFDVVSKKIDR